MPSPIFLAYELGETFSNINTFAIGNGIAWGSCMLAYREIDFSDSGERGPSRLSFRGCSTDEDRFELYVGADRRFRESVELPRRTASKPVRGVTLGFSAGGILDMFSNISDFVRRIFQEMLANVAGNASLTTGVTGGLFNTWDGGVLHPLNGNTYYNLDIERFRNYNYCMIQGGVGAGVSANATLLFIGNFGSITHFTRDATATSLSEQSILSYLISVWNSAKCCALIQELSAGVILPGGGFNILSSD